MPLNIDRAMEGELLRISGQFPVTVLTGPGRYGASLVGRAVPAWVKKPPIRGPGVCL
jgi:hypothetical protein